MEGKGGRVGGQAVSFHGKGSGDQVSWFDLVEADGFLVTV